MQVLVVEFRIDPARVADFESAIHENARLSRENEPGCRQFDVCRDPADPALFFLYELYDDEAAVQAHLRSSHFAAFDALVRPWVVSKAVQRLRRSSP